MALDINPKVTKLEPGDPVPAAAFTQQGSTFAERTKAAAKAAEAKVSAKQVDGEDEGAEDKSVSSSESKSRRTRKN